MSGSLAVALVLVNGMSMMWDWLLDHAALTTVMLIVSFVVLVASLWLCHYVLTTIPSDYFNTKRKPFEQWRTSKPALWWTLVITKNLVGALLIVAGLIMIFTPGQGILTVLLGISLVDIPGKRAWERKIIKRQPVLKVINRLRARANQPPLELS
ncbi:MAG: PGPGW domain-containing protein [Pirellulales bacterium]